MGLNSSSYYVIGPPINYTSIYGYPKRRFEVFQADEQGNKTASYPAGEIKEEPMLDENGELWGRCFYTKNLGREHGKYRFYPASVGRRQCQGPDHIERALARDELAGK